MPDDDASSVRRPAPRMFTLRCDWQTGDELIGHDNTRWRMVAVIPDELIGEFHNGPEYGLLAIEPV